MTIFDDLLSGERSLNSNYNYSETGVKTLASVSAESISQKEGNQEIRMGQEELENAYIYDPINFNAVNKTCQTIMATPYKLKCNDEESLIKINEFTTNMSKIGCPMTWEEFVYSCYQNCCIFGWQWVELVFNIEGDDIVDILVLDPKRMDYAKDSSGKIMLDKSGRPIGYTQIKNYSSTSEGDTPPEGLSLMNQIFIRAERIAVIKLYTVGDGFYPIGLIEPGYKSTLRKMNIEEAQSNSIYARGTYPLIDYVGDIDHQPTPTMIQNATNNLKKISHKRYFAFPYWHRIEPIEVKQSDIVDSTLDHLRENQSASFGMPLALATGAGEKTNRATLNNQQMIWEFTLNDIVKRVSSGIEKFIFRPIALYKKMKEVPEIVWGNISAEETNEKAKRLYMYAKAGLLTKEEVRDFIIKSEQL